MDAGSRHTNAMTDGAPPTFTGAKGLHGGPVACCQESSLPLPLTVKGGGARRAGRVLREGGHGCDWPVDY